MTEISQIDGRKPRLVGINHIAIEVGDINQALEFYGKIFDFKLRGKRVFRMSPLHHHFELSGWPESRVVLRFYIVGALLALLSLSTFKLQ